MSHTNNVLLECRDIVVDFGQKRALNKVSLAISKGECVSLVGPSGCGKTTMIKVIAGLQPVTSGAVLMEGRVVTKPCPNRMVLWQNVMGSLLPWKTCLGNLLHALQKTGVPKNQAQEVASEWLDKVGMARYADQYPIFLSGGQQQRVAIARAMALDAKLLIMDEPFSALDEENREVMQEEVLALQEISGTSIVIITHSVEEAAKLGDRVVVMQPNPGQVRAILQGTEISEANIRELIRTRHQEVRRAA